LEASHSEGSAISPPIGDLLLTIAPLTLLAAISPIVFLNAAAVTTNEGVPAGVRFLCGNLLVLAAIGTASVGFLGAAAASFAERQLASRGVDAVLGLLLLGYGVLLLSRHRRATVPESSPSTSTGRQRGVFTWGMIGMATNFTTLPLYVSVTQRIGASTASGAAQLALMSTATTIVLLPAWLPVVLAHQAPAVLDVRPKARDLVARSTRAASIAACGVGGAVLIWHAL
jgi:threonine/homoserine/homoserine lactone efflux protein